MKGSEQETSGRHLKVLDGWRGISILCVLSAHLLPLGPKAWQLNGAFAILGMTVFFCLSGFLITNFLLRHSSVLEFLIRRIFRIVPLAWLALPFGLWLAHASPDSYLAHFLFYGNLPPFLLTSVTAHYWSLCVEMQFYAGIALLFALGRRHSLKLLPVLCIAVTALRVYCGKYDAIETYFRLDEILSGVTLALIYNGEFGERVRRVLGRVNPWVIATLLLASTHVAMGFVDYGRPYFTAALVGASLSRLNFPFAELLRGRVLRYVARISYALYIVHPLLAHSWLGEGTTLVKYLKRPLLFVALFCVAHISTFYYESRWIAFGRFLSSKLAMHGGRTQESGMT